MKVINFVHCIDTEGPLNETLSQTFKRIELSFGLKIKPSKKNLELLQNKNLKIRGVSQKKIIQISNIFSKKLLSYNSSWKKINLMLTNVTSKSFRKKYPDSFGNSWIYNWFIMDHIGFSSNPHSRALGQHKVWNFYKNFYKIKKINFNDGFHFHHHPVHHSYAANKCATHYFSVKGTIYDSLNRRLIDKEWFPSCFRPGFHSVRPDINWFIEQFIPFEFSNQRTLKEKKEKQNDIKNGRFGDWRRATNTWEPYHPDINDYQAKGNCNHLKARVLNVGTRLRLLKYHDIKQAFRECSKGKKVVVSFANHDYRNIQDDISYVYNLILKAQREFRDIKFRWCEAKEAMLNIKNSKNIARIKFRQFFDNQTLIIKSDKKIFGPQPYLAIKTKKNKYFHDNFDIHRPYKQWSYTFDSSSIQLKEIRKIVWAANDSNGNTFISIINPITKKIKTKYI